jgi:hypothetical protein
MSDPDELTLSGAQYCFIGHQLALYTCCPRPMSRPNLKAEREELLARDSHFVFAVRQSECHRHLWYVKLP